MPNMTVSFEPLRASSFEPGNQAGPVTRTTIITIWEYMKFQFG